MPLLTEESIETIESVFTESPLTDAQLIELDRVKVGMLVGLQRRLAEAETREVEPAEFQELLTLTKVLLDLDQDTIAGVTRAARSTVSRWLSGETTPHRVARPSVFRELRKFTAERVRRHSDLKVRAE